MGQLPAMKQQMDNVEDKLNLALQANNRLATHLEKVEDRLRAVEQRTVKLAAVGGGTGAAMGGSLALLLQYIG